MDPRRVDIQSPIVIGNDHLLRLEGVVDAHGVPVDMTGWVVMWFLRTDPHALSAVVAKAGTIVGVYDSDPALNTLAAELLLVDTETELLSAGIYAYAWKRMAANFESDLAYGDQPVVRTASR